VVRFAVELVRAERAALVERRDPAAVRVPLERVVVGVDERRLVPRV
jgi:hypothetical protein